MTKDERRQASITELARGIRRGDLSPVDLVGSCLEDIERTNEASRVYITVAREQAAEAAHQACDEIRNGADRGPLHGIPYTCKDLFQTRGLRTTGGSRVLMDWVPETDAVAVQRLRTAGAVLLGKANLHEFAYGATGENPHFGTVSNPWDSTRLAGGSSSGSAAAVAGGVAVFALGTDTGGSVRTPACLCGVVGFKPTYDLISMEGVIPYCWSLDHVGIVGRCVSDVGMVLEALAPGAAQGPSPKRRPRLGVPRNFFFEEVDPEIVSAVKRVLTLCRTLGFETTGIDMPRMDETRTVSLLLQLPEMLSYHSRYLPDGKERYGEDIRAGMTAGQFILAEHYVRAKRMVEAYRRHMAAVFRDVDLIVTPACPVVAPKIGECHVTTGDRREPVGNAVTRFTSFFNLVGLPALTLPCGIHSSGLPVGVQLVGRHHEEGALLGAAGRLEEALGDDARLVPPP